MAGKWLSGLKLPLLAGLTLLCIEARADTWQYDEHHQCAQHRAEREVDESDRQGPTDHLGHPHLEIDHVGELQCPAGEDGDHHRCE